MSISDSELVTTSNFRNTPENCPICYDYPESFVSLRCSHKFCLTCFLHSVNHINIKCPLCRDLITEAQPILETYNSFLMDKEALMVRVANLELEKNILMQSITEKEETIDKYRETNMNLHNQSLTMMDKYISKIDIEYELKTKVNDLEKEIEKLKNDIQELTNNDN